MQALPESLVLINYISWDIQTCLPHSGWKWRAKENFHFSLGWEGVQSNQDLNITLRLGAAQFLYDSRWGLFLSQDDMFIVWLHSRSVFVIPFKYILMFLLFRTEHYISVCSNSQIAAEFESFRFWTCACVGHWERKGMGWMSRLLQWGPIIFGGWVSISGYRYSCRICQGSHRQLSRRDRRCCSPLSGMAKPHFLPHKSYHILDCLLQVDATT